MRFLESLRLAVKLVGSTLRARVSSLRRPIFVGFYLTNSCNLRCRYCFVNIENRFDDTDRRGFTKEEAFRIVDELYDMGTRWVFLLGGEPLLHEDIGEIVAYIVKKGIVLHILTNGTLIERKIDEIKPAHAVCVSLDGDESVNDLVRGKGSFARAVRGIKTAVAYGMGTRIHAVITRRSIGSFESLARLAKENGATLTCSTLNYLGSCGEKDKDLELSDDEYREFWRKYRELKSRGFPIGNSFYSIDKTLKWPIGYHEFIRKGQRFPDYKPIPCVIGMTHGCIDAEGTMFNCIQLGVTSGLNIRDVGIKRAWDELVAKRPQCISCSSVNTIETSAYLTLKPAVLMDALRFFFSHGKKSACRE